MKDKLIQLVETNKYDGDVEEEVTGNGTKYYKTLECPDYDERDEMEARWNKKYWDKDSIQDMLNYRNHLLVRIAKTKRQLTQIKDKIQFDRVKLGLDFRKIELNVLKKDIEKLTPEG